MTALVCFDRVFEVLDLPSTIQEKPDAVVLPPHRLAAGVRPGRVHLPAGRGVSLASLETVARAESRDSGQVLHDVSFAAEPGQMVALVGPSGAGKTTITHLVARLYDVGGGAVRVGGHDVRDVTLQSLEDAVGYVTQDAHMFHDTIRANLRYARPGRDRRARSGRRWRPPGSRRLVREPPGRAGHRGRRPGLPALGRGAAAAGDRPAAAEGPVDRGARRGDRAPGHRVRGRRAARPGRRRSRDGRRWSSPTGSPPSGTPTRSWWSRRAGSSQPAPTSSSSPRAGCTPTSTGTQFFAEPSSSLLN